MSIIIKKNENFQETKDVLQLEKNIKIVVVFIVFLKNITAKLQENSYINFFF